MRTTVYTNPHDPDEVDEFPGCFGCVEDNGALAIIDYETSGIETTYTRSQWASYETANE